jgi:hypothetical protein
LPGRPPRRLEVEAFGQGGPGRRGGLYMETGRQVGNLALQILDGPGVCLQAFLHGLGSLLIHGDRDQAMRVIQRKMSRSVITRYVKTSPLLRWRGWAGRQRRGGGCLALGHGLLWHGQALLATVISLGSTPNIGEVLSVP